MAGAADRRRFIAVVIASFGIGGEPPSADKGAAEVVKFYKDNYDSVQFGAALTALAGALMIFFAGYLRKVLSAAEGAGGMLSAVVFAGAIVFAVGTAIDGTLSFAMAEAVNDDVDPTAVLAIQAIWDNDFLPFAMGIFVFILASGISVLRHGALPKWLGIFAILLAVIALTPIGWAAAIGTAVWILIVSVLLTLQAKAATT